MEAKYVSRATLKTPLDPRSYLRGIPAVRHLIECGYISFEDNVTFFVGENGTGKSTLLEAIAVAFGFNPEGGTRNFNFSTRESHSELCRHIAITKRGYPKDGFFLRAESLYNVATDIERMEQDSPGLINSYGGVSLHNQSHGESFLSLVQNRFGGHGLYILDEPEAALSPTRLMSLMIEIKRLVRTDSQLIIATHSPILMAFPGACIYQINDEGIKKVDYRSTDHYLVTKQFLDDPERIFRYLFDDGL
ncbi:MAG: AAA family ATPase [Clostridiaceae bacterium]|nr:AAA family ATPase [Clostridiaceae bacterium]